MPHEEAFQESIQNCSSEEVLADSPSVSIINYSDICISTILYRLSLDNDMNTFSVVVLTCTPQSSAIFAVKTVLILLCCRMSETEMMLAHLQSFSSNVTYYKVPDSVKSGVPLFYLPANSPNPQISLQHPAKYAMLIFTKRQHFTEKLQNDGLQHRLNSQWYIIQFTVLQGYILESVCYLLESSPTSGCKCLVLYCTLLNK